MGKGHHCPAADMTALTRSLQLPIHYVLGREHIWFCLGVARRVHGGIPTKTDDDAGVLAQPRRLFSRGGGSSGFSRARSPSYSVQMGMEPYASYLARVGFSGGAEIWYETRNVQLGDGDGTRATTCTGGRGTRAASGLRRRLCQHKWPGRVSGPLGGGMRKRHAL